MNTPYQLSLIQEQKLSKAEEFWQQVLRGFTAPTPLVVDKSTGVGTTTESDYARQEIQLSEAVTLALQSLAQDNELTLNTLLQGVWALLLSRYSSEEEVLFGVTKACHGSAVAGAEFLINPLPVRVSVSPERPLLPWLKELQTRWTTWQDYEHTPLVKVQEWSDIPHDTPLFESILVLENDQGDSWENQDFLLAEQTSFPLKVQVSIGSELLLTIEYDSQRFEQATITRMLGHLQTLLVGIVNNPHQCLSELPLLTEPERHQLLVEWNNTRKDYPKDTCIHQLFEAQVERSPDAVAVVFEDQQLTYRELNSRANQLAHHLRTLGVKPDVSVGICVERSLEMVVGLLGILKASGAYVPLDPAYPPERLTYMLQDSQVPVLLTQKQLVDGLPEHKAHVLCLDTDWDVIAQQSEENLASDVKTGNLAYVIYTSGSTGKPKGVAMKQLPLVNLLLWQLDNSTISSGGRTVQFAPISFDVSFQEIFSTCCSGGTLILLSEEVRRDPLALLHLLTEAKIERLFLPFVALQQLAEGAVTAKLVPTSLREIITAGEQLQISPLIINLFGKLKDCTLHNQYGPSESHVVTAFDLTGSASSWPALPPIGRPIDNTQIYLLDQNLQPVPIGVPGELYIGGICLARGYINRPDLTKERFIPDPFNDDPEARLYKTGDLARYLPDGNIEYIGRIDNQVKIRGFRIELGEVETVLAQCPAVQKNVVIAREDNPGNRRLVAYVVPNQEQVTTTKELRHFLRERLPNYMVPSAYVILDALPLTPSGKIARRTLPAPSQTKRELEENFVAPRNEVELQLAKIWEEVLGIQPIGVRDNFFELGGHSLLATQVVSRLCKAFQVEIPLHSFFELPTVAELAECIETLRWTVQDLQFARSSVVVEMEEIEL
ncbi:MAG: amino acid adenylation domain-containing protein [Coleofasciculaceae cyanobacterium]